MNSPYSIQPPLSNIPAELLKLFSVDIPDKQLDELKNIIARFLLEKARDKPMRYGMKKNTPMKSCSKF